jgi:hypothetical protein
MPLKYSGESAELLNSTEYKATGNDAEGIVVEAPNKIIQDYGQETVRIRGSGKYDNGQVSDKRVNITDADFD